MAMPAIDHSRFDPDMRFVKRCALSVVAFPASGLNGLVEQGGLGRKMGLVASFAIAAGRLVRLLLFHPGLQILMASETQVRALGQEKVVQFCLVRAVAFCALIRQ